MPTTNSHKINMLVPKSATDSHQIGKSARQYGQQQKSLNASVPCRAILEIFYSQICYFDMLLNRCCVHPLLLLTLLCQTIPTATYHRNLFHLQPHQLSFDTNPSNKPATSDGALVTRNRANKSAIISLSKATEQNGDANK